MDLYSLKMFFNLGKSRSFTETAKMMYITQSAVSHGIKKLERSIGTKLIERKSGKFALTEAGRRLFISCENIFYELDNTRHEIEQIKERDNLNIVLGSPVEFGTTILLKHMQDFILQNPKIHIDFFLSHDLQAPFIEDRVDVMIDCVNHDLQGVDKLFLFREQYVVITTPWFIEEYRINSVKDLKKVPVLSMDKTGNWWNNFTRALPENEIEYFENIIQINHVRGIINGAINNLGVGFVPKYTVINELKEKILVDPFEHIQPEADMFYLYIKTKRKKIDKIRLMIDYLTSIKPAEFGSS
ncbi:MAG: LysR family transcriptional regulator [Acidobacteria bacterium]|nr:LysR family transcriptional regulator [Acidobacteriota bacterium]